MPLKLFVAKHQMSGEKNHILTVTYSYEDPRESHYVHGADSMRPGLHTSPTGRDVIQGWYDTESDVCNYGFVVVTCEEVLCLYA